MRKGSRATDKLVAGIAEAIANIPIGTVRAIAKKAAAFTLAYKAALEPKPPTVEEPKRRADPIDVIFPGGLPVAEEVQQSWNAFEDFVHGVRISPCGMSQENDDAERDLPVINSEIVRRYKSRESLEQICSGVQYKNMFVSPQYAREVLKRKGFTV